MSDSKALELIKSATTLPDLLTAIAPVRKAASTDLVVVKTTKEVILTDKVKEALETVARVGTAVNVTEHRALTSDEQTALMAERQLLDTIEKYIKDRKEAHKTMGYHHLDAELEASGEIEGLDRDKDGFFVTAGRIPVPTIGKSFAREVRGGGPTITAEALEHAVDRKDYVAMTTEVRVLDEAKVMLHLRRHPELAERLGDAVETTPATTAWAVRPL